MFRRTLDQETSDQGTSVCSPISDYSITPFSCYSYAAEQRPLPTVSHLSAWRCSTPPCSKCSNWVFLSPPGSLVCWLISDIWVVTLLLWQFISYQFYAWYDPPKFSTCSLSSFKDRYFLSVSWFLMLASYYSMIIPSIWIAIPLSGLFFLTADCYAWY